MGHPAIWALALALGVAIGYLSDVVLLTPAVPPEARAADRVVSPPTAAPATPPPMSSPPREQQAVLTLEEPPAPPPQKAPPPRKAAAPKAEVRQPRPRPPAPTDTLPAPSAPSVMAEAVAPPPPRDITITRAVMDRGQRFLSGEEGKYPMLVAHYPSLGFQGYAQAVRNFGGRFFVRDLDARVLRAEIDVVGGRLLSIDTAALASLSPLSRDLSDEPALGRFLWEAERTYGRARYAVLLLVPVSIDAAVLGGVEDALRMLARAPQDIVFVEGEYRRRGGDLVLELTTAHARSGDVLPLRAVINLSRIPR